MSWKMSSINFKDDPLHVIRYNVSKTSRKMIMTIRGMESGSKWLQLPGNGRSRVTNPIDPLYMPHVEDFTQIICIYEAYP